MDAIAFIALVISSLSLGWQIVAWRLAGARARAELLYGMASATDLVAAPVARAGRTLNKEALQVQMPGAAEVIGIEVTNHGRSGVVVDSILIKVRGGQVLGAATNQPLSGPELPHTIGPGGNAAWYVPRDLAETVIAASRGIGETPTGVYMAARLGTGKILETVKSLNL